jgi:unsaturated chondroitin disaccharide hydrolase
VSRARSFTLPRDAVVSFDGPSAGGASFYLGHDSVVTFSTGGPPAGWHSEHVEISGGRVYVDGSVFPRVRVPQAARLLRVPPGTSGLIISSVSDRAALLFHRLAELHARVPAGRFPTGADLGDRIYYDPGWTSGFYAGALWQAAALEPAGGMFARWALAETLDHLGLERSPTHDVGFMYGQSSLNAWRALCGGSAGALAGLGSPALCARLRASVLSAADELLALAATNPGAGTIPTDPTSRLGDTIVDSMMNIAILPWASRVTGRAAYATLAARQARVIGSLLVRRDGSTAQAANFDRSSGRLLFIATHQGLSAHSTWSRGEAWALYGFSQAAVDLHDRALLAIALKVARYVGTHLPPGGVPRWDYDAPAGAPVDVSAGVITAAGFMHLAEACRQLGGSGCSGVDVAGFRALSRRMLAAALGYASAAAPLGLLRSQIQDERSRCWCNHGELIYGLSYALEALRLQLSLRS